MNNDNQSIRTWLDRDLAMKAIRQLGEDDLAFLNALIVERLKLLAQAHSTVQLARFTVGDRVSFTGPSGTTVRGVVIRLNKKTASVQTTDGRQWNVSPALLKQES